MIVFIMPFNFRNYIYSCSYLYLLLLIILVHHPSAEKILNTVSFHWAKVIISINNHCLDWLVLQGPGWLIIQDDHESAGTSYRASASTPCVATGAQVLKLSCVHIKGVEPDEGREPSRHYTWGRGADGSLSWMWHHILDRGTQPSRTHPVLFLSS